MVKVEITGKKVIFYDANLCKDGVSAEQVLSRDREKLGKWKTRIKNLSEALAERARRTCVATTCATGVPCFATRRQRTSATTSRPASECLMAR